MEMIISLCISEPWDFTSSDGDNQLRVKYIEKHNDIVIAESLSNYKGKTERIAITKRDNNGNVNIYNINENGELFFSMIGSYNQRNWKDLF